MLYKLSHRITAELSPLLEMHGVIQARAALYPPPWFSPTWGGGWEVVCCASTREVLIGPERERNVLFNDALNTFYLWLYDVRHMVKDHSDSEKGNPLPPHRLLLSINSKGSFICTIPQTG